MITQWNILETDAVKNSVHNVPVWLSVPMMQMIMNSSVLAPPASVWLDTDRQGLSTSHA